MASLKDYKRFKNSIIGIDIKKKGKKEYLVFTINPQKLVNRSQKRQKGGEIFSILAPYVISLAVVSTTKLLKDMYNVVKDKKTGTKEYFKQKYGSLRKFAKNFIGSPEILLSVATPLLYKKIIGNIPNKELSSYLLKQSTYYAEQLPRRFDYRFDKKYSVSYLKNSTRTFDELEKIADSIGIKTTIQGLTKKEKNITKKMLSNNIVKAIYGDILPSITGVTSSIKNQQAENKRIEKKEIEETGENIMNINFDDTGNDSNEKMETTNDDSTTSIVPAQMFSTPQKRNGPLKIKAAQAYENLKKGNRTEGLHVNTPINLDASYFESRTRNPLLSKHSIMEYNETQPRSSSSSDSFINGDEIVHDYAKNMGTYAIVHPKMFNNNNTIAMDRNISYIQPFARNSNNNSSSNSSFYDSLMDENNSNFISLPGSPQYDDDEELNESVVDIEDLNSKTKDDLKTIAIEFGLKRYSNLNKSQLIEKIRNEIDRFS